MSTETFTPVPVEQFGGLCTLMAPEDVPQGMSPDCQDVEFVPGGYRIRPGSVAVYSAISSTPRANSLKSYITLGLAQRLLTFTDDGRLFKDAAPPGTLTLVASGLAALAYMKSTTLFGREYMAFSNGTVGVDIPRVYDDTNLDRVSQNGPGEGPTVADDTGVFKNIVNPTGAVRLAGILTITTTTVHGYAVGQKADTAGISDATMNAVGMTILTTPTTTSFTVAQAGANGNGNGGVVNAYTVGNIPAGAHQVGIWFETRTFGWTKISPPVTWNAGGGKRVTLTGIPIGPANVTKRMACFTLAGGARFYHLVDRMILADNSTTTLTLDFNDSTLASGTSVDYLLRSEVIPSAAGVIDYVNRLVWWGEEFIMQGWKNLTFDGGFSAGRPLGWTAGAAFAGASEETVDSATYSALKITGDGATAVRGQLTQGALIEPWGLTTLILPNKAYTVKARIKKSAGLVAGRLNIHLIGTLGTAINTVGLQLTAGAATTSYVEYSATLTVAQPTLSTDLLLEIYADQTPTNAQFFLVDEIKILPSDAVAPNSTLRVSRTFQPDTYDGTQGLINVAEKNGQAIRTCISQRGYLYVIKERSTHVVQADTNEPAFWSENEVDEIVGTPSVEGAANGEGWFVVANRNGLYYFSGGAYTKVSQEIQPTWDSINWEGAGKTVWVRVDAKKKRVLVGVPIGGAATAPTKILALDIVEGWADPLVNQGHGRKWSIWNLAMNSCAVVETSSSSQVWLGNNAANGKIYRMDSTVMTDDGVAIAEKYRLAFLGNPGGSSSGLTLFAYMTMYVKGSGNLTVKAYGPGDVVIQTLNTFALSSPASKDTDFPMNVQFERTSFEFSTTGAGDWHQISKVVPYATQDPTGGSR